MTTGSLPNATRRPRPSPLYNEKSQGFLPWLFSSPRQTRTADRVVNSHLLYRLSYRGMNTLNVQVRPFLVNPFCMKNKVCLILPTRLFIGCGLPVQRFAHARRGAAIQPWRPTPEACAKIADASGHTPAHEHEACLLPCPPSSFTDAFPISLIPSVNKVPVSLCLTDGFEVLGFIAVRNPSVLQQDRKKRHLRPYDQSCFVQQ